MLIASQDRQAGRTSAPRPFVRLRRRADFQRVSRGRRKSSSAFVLQMALQSESAAEGPRIGFTVTRKTGGSVERNRIRRRLKEALRAAGPLEARADCDYVLVARREALTRDFAALIADLRSAFAALTADPKEFRASAGAPAGRAETRRT
jgi:ribonuclease P protein component